MLKVVESFLPCTWSYENPKA